MLGTGKIPYNGGTAYVGSGIHTNGTTVGIGANADSRTMRVHSETGNASLIVSNAATGSGVYEGVYLGYTAQAWLWNFQNTPLAIGTNNKTRLTVDGGGSVGVGITAPTALLHINSITDETVAEQLRLSADGADPTTFTIDQGDLLIQPAVSVGINVVVNPEGKLHVRAGSRDNTTALMVEQSDAQEAIIGMDGAVGSNTSNPISHWTRGNAIEGFVKVKINGQMKWMPYYGAPTS